MRADVFARFAFQMGAVAFEVAAVAVEVGTFAFLGESAACVAGRVADRGHRSVWAEGSSRPVENDWCREASLPKKRSGQIREVRALVWFVDCAHSSVRFAQNY